MCMYASKKTVYNTHNFYFSNNDFFTNKTYRPIIKT